MTFHQTDGASVVANLRALTDEQGVPVLQKMGELWGWGPNTQWDVPDDDSGTCETGAVLTLLALTLERSTPVWLETLLVIAPLNDHPWGEALVSCCTNYHWRQAGGDGVVREQNQKSALQLAWKSPAAWAVEPILSLKKAMRQWDSIDTWGGQIVQASEALGVRDRKAKERPQGARWQPYWAALKKAALIMDVAWPGPDEDWTVQGTGSWLETHRHAWDQLAVMLDTPQMLEASWTEGCGHAMGALPLRMTTLPEVDAHECSHLFATSIGESGPGAQRCMEWFMRQTDLLTQPPKGPPTPYWARGTWKAAIEAGAVDPTRAVGTREAYAVALSVLRNLSRHDPIPPSRRPRSRP